MYVCDCEYVVHVCMCVCMYVYEHMYKYVFIVHVYVYVCVFCVHVCIYLCIGYVCMLYMCVFMHTHMFSWHFSHCCYLVGLQYLSEVVPHTDTVGFQDSFSCSKIRVSSRVPESALAAKFQIEVWWVFSGDLSVLYLFLFYWSSSGLSS